MISRSIHVNEYTNPVRLSRLMQRWNKRSLGDGQKRMGLGAMSGYVTIVRASNVVQYWDAVTGAVVLTVDTGWKLSSIKEPERSREIFLAGVHNSESLSQFNNEWVEKKQFRIQTVISSATAIVLGSPHFVQRRLPLKVGGEHKPDSKWTWFEFSTDMTTHQVT